MKGTVGDSAKPAGMHSRSAEWLEPVVRTVGRQPIRVAFFRIGIGGFTVQKVLDDALIYEILAVVEEIPYGCVATYGQIARLIGRDRNARLVGKVLSRAEYYGAYPCHRVVNHQGRTAPGWPEQALLLAAEGVTFRANGLVDMKRHQWDC